MKTDWDSHLDRWVAAGVIDASAATRVREWESRQISTTRLRWPILIALAFGALLLGAGILLFVAAHWDELSPPQRMALVVLLVAGFHVGGALSADRFPALCIALHTVGTAALGAGIALSGQIFHLSEHWPAAVLLWAIGAGSAWGLLGHWTQGGMLAILTPYWLCAEFQFWVGQAGVFWTLPIALGITALAFSYLGARRDVGDTPFRKTLMWVGGIALIPACAALGLESASGFRYGRLPSLEMQLIGWSAAVLIPIGVALLLRRREVLGSLVAITWSTLLGSLGAIGRSHLVVFGWCAIGAVGLVAWGVHEARAERINLGILGFVVTIVTFYFSDVMDMLGRSASLILLGSLFLGGGWMIERTRRRLIAQIQRVPQ